jgi:hypothetical protein
LAKGRNLNAARHLNFTIANVTKEGYGQSVFDFSKTEQEISLTLL